MSNKLKDIKWCHCYNFLNHMSNGRFSNQEAASFNINIRNSSSAAINSYKLVTVEFTKLMDRHHTIQILLFPIFHKDLMRSIFRKFPDWPISIRKFRYRLTRQLFDKKILKLFLQGTFFEKIKQHFSKKVELI